MQKQLPFLIALFLFMGVGCSEKQNQKQTIEPENIPPPETIVVSPLSTEKGYPALYKRFGEFFQDRFAGYHTGDDLEITDENPVSVHAMADGIITYAAEAQGYGGVMVLTHVIEGEMISSLYGHVDLASSDFRVGDSVQRGDQLVELGEAFSAETDGERKHLHFAVWKGNEVRLRGYVDSPSALADWLNPLDFLIAHDAIESKIDWTKSSTLTIGEPASPTRSEKQTAFDQLSFSVPQDLDIEYVPSIEALNLFTASGNGSARERSQILIRYFDASDFLTLSTVTIYSREDLSVGLENYSARRYDIEKKPEVAAFKDQPSWRNARHIVTDFRSEDGFTRYFVIAANPELDKKVYEKVLQSMKIEK